MINCVINLHTVSSGYSELYCRSGSRSRTSRKSGGAERWAGVAEKIWRKRHAERERSGGYRNRL